MRVDIDVLLLHERIPFLGSSLPPLEHGRGFSLACMYAYLVASPNPQTAQI